MLMKVGARISALLFYTTVTVAAVLGTIAATLITGRHPDPLLTWLTKTLFVLLLVLWVTWLFLRRAGMSWGRYGITSDAHSARYAITGLASGLALALVWAASMWFWAPYTLELNPTFSPRVFILSTLATIAIGIAEEIGYRTYGFECLEKGFGQAMAVALPSLLFAAMHTTGGMPWLAALCVVGSSSVLYGVLMLATRNLPFVAAFHIATNLLQDAVMRTGNGSFFLTSFSAPERLTDQSTRIWISMMAVNVLVAACVWRGRRALMNDTHGGG